MKNKRYAKYQEMIQEHPKMKNQLVVQDGKAILVREGKSYSCEEIEGYIKFPSLATFEKAEKHNFIVCVLPKEKLIVGNEQGNYYCGYKKENTPHFQIVVRAKTEQEEVIIIWLHESVPIIVAMDDGFLDDSLILKYYKTYEYLLGNTPSENCCEKIVGESINGDE